MCELLYNQIIEKSEVISTGFKPKTLNLFTPEVAHEQKDLNSNVVFCPPLVCFELEGKS
jgi:hypothetical protein